MKITGIELHNFRNYESLRAEFQDRVNLIVGPNAQGKTNLIEAIYVSSVGKSFRTAKDKDLIRFGCESASIRTDAEKAYGKTKVEVFLGGRNKKMIRKDGSVIRRLSELMSNIIVVSFTPEDLRIVKDEPVKRRRFIDHELSQIRPAYYNSLMRYREALLQRNACLKEEYIDPSVLSVWDETLISHGAEVMKMRDEFLHSMSGFSCEFHEKITNGKETLRLEYTPNVEFSPNPEEQREILRETFEKNLDTDMKLRTTMAGPHKDDFTFFVNGVNIRNFGSQGQQRTAALSVTFANLAFIRKETGEDAILLLDDVMSELDPQRREYLVRAFSDNQIFITTTDLDEEFRGAFPDAKIFRVNGGKIESENEA